MASGSEGNWKCSERFARVPDSWIRALLDCRVLTIQAAVFLKLCENLQDEGGRPWAWRSTESLAESLRIPRRSVEKALQALREKGAIEVKQMAHRRRSTEYWILKATPQRRSNQPECYTSQGSIATPQGCTHKKKEGPRRLEGGEGPDRFATMFNEGD